MADPGELDGLLREALKSQYRAALSMLRQVVQNCPANRWTEGDPPFWQVAYHTAFFAHFYLGRDVSAFTPWEHHRPNTESLDSPPVPMGPPHTQVQMLDYLSKCVEMIDPAIDATDLLSRDSGFPWYKVSKIEHQIINIRHIQHHTIYLSAALRAAGEQPATWISPSESNGHRDAV